MTAKKIKAVIFDMDGTLLNTLEDLADSMNHVLKESGYPVRSLEEIRTFVGNGIRKLVERAMGYPDGTIFTEDQKKETDRVFARMTEYYEEHCNIKTAPYAGITECLHSLKQRGIRTAVVSNKLDGAVKELTEIYFSEWMQESAGDQPGIRRKPAPDMVRLIMEHMGVTPEECVYAGDSEVDIETAENAGVPCISVLWGFRDKKFLWERGAGAMAETPEELPAVIDTWNQFREKKYKYLLFDLDGTLTNPEEGITKSVQYALKDFGIQADTKELLCFIGPPLRDSFMDFYGFDKAQADRAVEKYRERYLNTGVFENFAYEGMRELLQELKAQGYLLGVATSKPEVMAHKVLEKYGLEEWFDVVTGSELDGARSRKSEVIEETLRRFRNTEGRASKIDRSGVLMIGDRRYDIQGAKEASMDSVGVYYGFAEPGELEQAGADYVVRTVRELRSLLCGR